MCVCVCGRQCLEAAAVVAGFGCLATEADAASIASLAPLHAQQASSHQTLQHVIDVSPPRASTSDGSPRGSLCGFRWGLKRLLILRRKEQRGSDGAGERRGNAAAAGL